LEDPSQEKRGWSQTHMAERKPFWVKKAMDFTEPVVGVVDRRIGKVCAYRLVNAYEHG
jgi:hypothetical protein